MGIVKSIWILIGVGIFVLVMGLITYFISRPPRVKEERGSLMEKAMEFGENWLKKNVYTGGDERFYFPEARARTLEDLYSQRIYWGFKIRRVHNNQLIVFIVSKPKEGKMDMWDWYDYPSPKLINDPLCKIEKQIKERIGYATPYPENKYKTVVRTEVGREPEVEKGKIRGPEKKDRW